jgi:hypothetical protein
MLPPEQHFPVPLIGLHGLLAVTTAEGSASRACRTSWVGMVIRGVRFASMLVVYLGAR